MAVTKMDHDDIPKNVFRVPFSGMLKLVSCIDLIEFFKK